MIAGNCCRKVKLDYYYCWGRNFASFYSAESKMQQAQKDERNVEDFQKLVRPFFPVIKETFRTDDSRPGF